MYSPKISEHLVKRLYLMAKRKNMPMTQLADTLIETGLTELEHHEKIVQFSVLEKIRVTDSQEIKMAV